MAQKEGAAVNQRRLMRPNQQIGALFLAGWRSQVEMLEVLEGFEVRGQERPDLTLGWLVNSRGGHSFRLLRFPILRERERRRRRSGNSRPYGIIVEGNASWRAVCRVIF